MTKKIVIGNWKMNPVSFVEANKIYKDIVKNLPTLKKTEVVVCPPVVYLENLKKVSKKISLGVQNSSYVKSGAFTGELSAKMLSGVGAKYVILGHSERRSPAISGGENNELINKKVINAIAGGLIPVLCVGENVRDASLQYLGFIETQILECFEGVSKNALKKVIIAYEPIWAIGENATRSATPAEFLEISIFIKKILSDKYGAKNITELRIIYGGSVHPENALSFLMEGQADGFLPGRDSLKPKKFLEIIKIVEDN